MASELLLVTSYNRVNKSLQPTREHPCTGAADHITRTTMNLPTVNGCAVGLSVGGPWGILMRPQTGHLFIRRKPMDDDALVEQLLARCKGLSENILQAADRVGRGAPPRAPLPGWRVWGRPSAGGRPPGSAGGGERHGRRARALGARDRCAAPSGGQRPR